MSNSLHAARAWQDGLVWIGIGCNLSPKLYHWQRATTGLAHLRGLHLLEISKIYRSPAQGDRVSGTFWNAAALARCDCEPRQLLLRLKHLERSLGRRGAGNRPVDFDILLWHDAIGWRRLAMPGLRIPHPRMHNRRFVLTPLDDLAGSPAYPDSLRRAIKANRRRPGSLSTVALPDHQNHA